MKVLTIQEWQSLFESDRALWKETVQANLKECLAATDASVISVLLEHVSAGDGPLRGVPCAVKDLFDVSGVATHNSSVLPQLVNTEAEKDSELVMRLHAFGATCVAKTQMNEFAYGLSGENPHYGDCMHPVLDDCLSGGSSSGSAYLVAAGVLPLAFGTDTGGSIRLPASWCGLYGIRWVPDYMMEGAFPLAPSFDTMGWFTRSAEEMSMALALWFEQEDTNDQQPLRGSSFVPESLLKDDVSAAITSELAAWPLQESDATPALEELLPRCQRAFNILQSREAFIIHDDWLRAQGALYDPAVRARIERAQTWESSEVEEALLVWEEIREWFDVYFSKYDYLVMPVCPGPSIPLSEATPELRENTLKLTSPASLAQKPVLTIPVWLDSKRSVGIQFIFKDNSPKVPLRILDLCKSI